MTYLPTTGTTFSLESVYHFFHLHCHILRRSRYPMLCHYVGESSFLRTWNTWKNRWPCLRACRPFFLARTNLAPSSCILAKDIRYLIEVFHICILTSQHHTELFLCASPLWSANHQG